LSFDCPHRPGRGPRNSGGNDQAPSNRAHVNFCSTMHPETNGSMVQDVVVDSSLVSSEAWEFSTFPEFDESDVCAPEHGKVKN